ncbi:MAG: porphobilinogen synthase [Simkaniaceae bacterium]|nr:porphobilinogen synthase [Simkaniaceae bacterium]
MFKRLRRNRKSPSIRALLQETSLSPADLVAPLFVTEGENLKEKIPKLPGIFRYSLDQLISVATQYHALGIQAIALFPHIDPALRNEEASEAYHPSGLIPRTLATLKRELPSLTLISDIALDPYTSHGHDGVLDATGWVDNDMTVDILVKQALSHAVAGADIVAPSDMMDGRIQCIREALDANGFPHVSILSYTAKYASSLYAPFREAINTKLSFGDKKSYQMDPSNAREALLEAAADEAEGADMLLVKPALPYLDIISKLRASTHLPIGAYHVSGEYAMVMAAQEMGMLDAHAVFYEQALSIKRAGADFIFTYAIDSLLETMSSRLTSYQIQH